VLFDLEGREYLDFVAGIAANVLGHCHPVVVEALRRQAETLIHCSNLYYTLPQVELAELLSRLAFGGRGKAFFCQSGAEAVEGAIKLARKYAYLRGKAGQPIVCFKNAFHGRTLGALAATGRYTEGFGPLPAGFVSCPFGELGPVEEELRGGAIAVLVEPIQGEGGVWVAGPEFLRGLRELCDRYGALLILDEVQTAMGRTGRMFAWEHWGVVPDILVLAKGLGGGFPIGCLLARPEVAEAFSPGDHGSTFGGNPLGAATALAVVRFLLKENLPRRAGEKGELLGSGLRELGTRFPFVREVRGMGLMWGVELTVPARPLALGCLEEGLLVSVTAERVLRFLPPLTVEEEEIARALEVVGRVFRRFSEKMSGGG
jgi:predicted acetylornithine/succinylornithine family transaminase